MASRSRMYGGPESRRHERGMHSDAHRGAREEESRKRDRISEVKREVDSPGRERHARRSSPEPKKPKVHAKPDFGLSGALAEETNTFQCKQLKWNEPPDMRKPAEKWRLYTFKDGAPLEKDPYKLRNAAYMFGRDRKLCDIPCNHPTISMQHCIVCFRCQPGQKTQVRPYVMDLETTNGTFVNQERLPTSRYVELHHKDVIQFGTSTREFVLLQE
eukprot:NODE_4483_length_781_cov_7.775229_g4324_i0.p2 GENE.NODE_4483_length_781_cov_7.775229_g4324_i0~~NODE_4483_length_781_cov_7.775229_g4324_i0.p2  ORF type:complete len:215 (-),score=51.72 NODE_4483_length_781_cov_7.775229_g4324_i0:71-715(-)